MDLDKGAAMWLLGGMLGVERKQAIIETILRERRVLVAELAARFAVTEETVRRDLAKLEAEGLVQRTHGGAVALRPGPEDLPYPLRQVLNLAAKRAIAARAAEMVEDGASVMLDSSSTVHEVLPHLERRRDLTLITNSVRLPLDPSAARHSVVSVGGELRPQSMTFVGPLAIQALSRFKADIAFISCKAVSMASGLMEASIADAEVKRAFIAQARRVVLLVDASKFDGGGMISVAEIAAISTLVTDRSPSGAWVDHLGERSVQLICR